ncbi:efflux transporter outer membrane subunit [Shimwellia blattae]|uniref:Multidrug efflux outer membrane protein EefC n=1 Tax=Shimwellia blattae (strain ATCC 29907 / DSM 4481 / JCM 1650 / NBRC 105725 / CDC 9005-74) TaxID=630626 RepID=I2BBC9_SHIBC|nr:efflux transporter outer membrane subunit [Shimwellia blattae]AFJ47833.1 multidrug efflux outer membrane protein EefC [Shimwellia blattae DSM 4481 = NBRC 105725]GAB79596.1 cation efflux system protein CusC [Shimwellia blattae DSM 4481 = NBRC 105725]VDY65329.1 Probable efflux pump outer membrane protein ttgC precursor [Shimwellia blattae]VEC24253.1 Probable efflux pump outer membrane protein ttgC precursor [Shimwellia blattae]
MLRMSLLFLSLLTAGCVSLDPDYHQPAAPVPSVWPGAQNDAAGKAVLRDWQEVVNDTRLKSVVHTALTNNRDIQKAIADIDAARALYGEQRADLFPSLDAGLSTTRSRSLTAGYATSSSAVGTASFELDLFGRNQSLSRAAKENWLASEFTARNTRLTLVAEITTAWITMAADNSNLALAKDIMNSARDSLNIVKRQQSVGVASVTDVSEAMSVYQQARSAVAGYQTIVMQDKNALDLLAGQPLAASVLPGTLESLNDNTIVLVPAGVSSSVLLRRPDIQEAEHQLKSANASIGAARANFFPSISLTGTAGYASGPLGQLWGHGMNIWSFTPSISLPIFNAGRNEAQLQYAEAEKQALVATYEKSIQSAFRDVSDALARRATLDEQLDAQQQYVQAEQQTLDVAQRRYQEGVGDYLTVLTARRTLWSARRQLIALQQTNFNNRVTLWQSLGGGVD